MKSIVLCAPFGILVPLFPIRADSKDSETTVRAARNVVCKSQAHSIVCSIPQAIISV